MLARITFVLLVIICSVGAFGGSIVTRFPGPRQKVESPNHAYSVENIDSDEPPYHSLFVYFASENARQKILDYQRHVDVIWAERSDFFFVNDYIGSNEATCKIFAVPALKRIDLLELIRAGDVGGLPDVDHVYVTCERWHSDAVELSLRGWGGGDPDGIERKYSLNPRTQKIRRFN